VSIKSSKTKPNKALQTKLRARVLEEGLHRVSVEMEIGREAISRYLADLPMHTSTFRGIEATLSGAHLPGATESGLRR